MNRYSLDVRRFGAKGNGKTDDTRAIQKALDEASHSVLTRQDTHDVPYPDGIPGRCGYHYHSMGPEVFFPLGHYVISAPLLPRNSLALRGEGHPWIEQKDSQQDIIYCEDSIRQSFDCLAFHGGRMHLNLGNNNEDNGQVRIEDCKFYGSKAVAIRMRKNSYSTMLLVLRCQIVGCEQAIETWTDFTHIREGWLTGGCREGGALIVNRAGQMTVSNLCGVPMVNGYDQRWIDNYGDITCRSVRFGGEEAGFTPVVNFARHRPQAGGNAVILDSCPCVCALGNAKRACAVYCEEIPNLIEIRGCVLTGIPPVMVSDKLNPQTYFRAKPGMVTFRFEGNVGEFANCIPTLLKKPRLNPPEGVRTLSARETREALKRARQDWQKRKAQTEKDAPLQFQGHQQRTRTGDYLDIVPGRYKFDLNDCMDATTEKNTRFYALAPAAGGVLVMRKAEGGWAHILIRDVAIDLDRFPYLTWHMIPTGSPAGLTVLILDKASGQRLAVEYSKGLSSGYRAYDLRKILKSGGKHILDIKLYYAGVRWDKGKRTNGRYARPGDYMVIPFVRAEK